MKYSKTIKIAGAGISGLTAAINLAKAGYKVEVYEKNEISGKRFHGDLQGIENWSFGQDALDFLGEVNIKTNFDYRGFRNVSLWGPGGFQKEIVLPTPAFYLVKRGIGKGCLDYGLQNQVSAYKNITIFYNQAVKPQDVDIVASGPFKQGSNVDGVVTGYIFKTNIEDQAVLILDDYYAIDGYSYFLVCNNYGVIASCIFRNYKDSSLYRERTLKLCKKYKRFGMEEVKQFGGTGNFFLGKIPPDKKIYIGEAGGVQDYLWGFGMRYALLTGYLAARSIIKKENYYDLFRREILPRLRTSVVNRLIFKLFNRVNRKMFINKIVKAENPINFLGRFYSPSFLKDLIYPLARIIFWKNSQDPRKL